MSEEFVSAIIYLLVFSCAILFFWMSRQTYSNISSRGNMFLRKIFLCVGVLLPCLLAGLRANSVGIDVEVYIVPHMRAACSPNVHSLFDCFEALDMAPEYLYMLLVYFCSRFTADEGFLLFMIQFFTIVPLALAAWKLRDRISVPLAMGTYLFCFYNNTLNMMRQSIACAFILLGAVCYLDNGVKLNKKSIACFVIACLFHKTGIIGVIGIYTICRISIAKLRRGVYIAIYACIILIPVILTPIYELMDSWRMWGWMRERIMSYADIFLYQTVKTDWIFESPFTLRFTLTTLCLLARIGIPYLCLRHCKNFDNTEITTIRSTAICGTLIYLIIQYSMRTIYGNRLAAFFDIFLILFVPYAAQGTNKRTKKNLLWIMIIVFWILWVLVLKWSGESHIYEFRFG